MSLGGCLAKKDESMRVHESTLSSQDGGIETVMQALLHTSTCPMKYLPSS